MFVDIQRNVLSQIDNEIQWVWKSDGLYGKKGMWEIVGGGVRRVFLIMGAGLDFMHFLSMAYQQG